MAEIPGFVKMHIDELRQAQRKGRDCTSVQISAA